MESSELLRALVHELEERLRRVEDAVQVPDEQCGDWPAPCNCDDPRTHSGHA